MDLVKLYLDNLKIKNYSNNTIIAYENDIKSFESFVIQQNFEKDIFLIRPRIARYYVNYLFENNISPRSINRKIISIKSLYSFLYNKKLIDNNPFSDIKLVKQPKKLPNIISHNEIVRLYKTIDTKTDLGFRNYLIFDILYTCGLRASEIVNIEISDINVDRKEILIHGKGKKDRYVFLTDRIITNLKLYLVSHRIRLLSKSGIITNVLFINYKGYGLTTRGLSKIINSIINKSGETYKISPHVIRHAFASSLLQNGADIRSVQELLGHKNLKTTQIYTHVTNEILTRNFNKANPRSNDDDKQ